MKYIRTKDGVYELVDTYYSFVNGVETYMYDDNGRGVEINSHQILKQSDSIEELCDEIVILRNGERPTILLNYDNLPLLKARVVKDNQKVYGAIWTDTGLKYVAKLNDKGELELIWENSQE